MPFDEEQERKASSGDGANGGGSEREDRGDREADKEDLLGSAAQTREERPGMPEGIDLPERSEPSEGTDVKPTHALPGMGNVESGDGQGDGDERDGEGDSRDGESRG